MNTIILSVLVVIIAIMLAELIRQTRRGDALAERNAAQAVTIAGLQRRLERSERREVPEPPRGPWHERPVTPENKPLEHDMGVESYPSTSTPPNTAVSSDFPGIDFEGSKINRSGWGGEACPTEHIPQRPGWVPDADLDECLRCQQERRAGCKCDAGWFRG